jgi:hypothetical protein
LVVRHRRFWRHIEQCSARESTALGGPGVYFRYAGHRETVTNMTPEEVRSYNWWNSVAKVETAKLQRTCDKRKIGVSHCAHGPALMDATA